MDEAEGGRVQGSGDPFHHEAFLYGSDDEYVRYLAPFIAEGVARGESVLVAVPAGKLGLLRDGVDGDANDQVRFASMEDIGRNPAWILPVWADLVAKAAQERGGLRGIGEQVWAGRTIEELTECDRNEALLNLAFGGASGFRLLCPYDITRLDPAVMGGVHRIHPHVSTSAGVTASPAYVSSISMPPAGRLSPVPPTARRAHFDSNSLGAVRHWSADIAGAARLAGNRIDDLTVAVSEGMTNSVRHGGGGGELWVWEGDGEVVCEIRDTGQIGDPLAGRVAPAAHQLDGRGLWIMTQLSDLIQLRAHEGGQAVRLHFQN